MNAASSAEGVQAGDAGVHSVPLASAAQLTKACLGHL